MISENTEDYQKTFTKLYQCYLGDEWFVFCFLSDYWHLLLFLASKPVQCVKKEICNRSYFKIMPSSFHFDTNTHG